MIENRLSTGSIPMQANLVMSKLQSPGLLRFFLTGIRILIGWHFLYEGLSKIFARNWTSAGYLVESHWLFSEFFHWIAGNPAVLRVVDLLNMWGLTLIGLGLFFGLFTRLARAANSLLSTVPLSAHRSKSH